MDERLKYIFETVKPMIEAKKKMSMKSRQGRFTSKNENYCCVRLRNKLSKYSEFEISENDIDVLPGWEIDITVQTPYGWNVAIEWDGAYHRKPIYGQAKLNMRKAQDDYKNKALYSKKYVLIRVRDDGSFNPEFVNRKVDEIGKIIDDLMVSNVCAYGKIEI